MTIQTVEFAGFAAAMQALRLSYGKEPRSKISFTVNVNQPRAIEHTTRVEFDQKDLQCLAPALIKKGDDHAKVLRGIQVWADIKAPIDWWCEMETYTVGHTRLMSESKMHTIYKGLTGDDLQAAREKTPITYPLEKIDMFSYQTLRRIYLQREGHRIGEWKVFLEWIETLPFFDELILGNKKEPLDVAAIVRQNCSNG